MMMLDWKRGRGFGGEGEGGEGREGGCFKNAALVLGAGEDTTCMQCGFCDEKVFLCNENCNDSNTSDSEANEPAVAFN